MVMAKNVMRRNLRQSILKSFGRYIAIVLIIALGASIFVGLLMTKTDMVATGQKFTDEQNMFDLRLLSTYGWDQEQVDAIAELDGVTDAEGQIYLDVIARQADAEDDAVYRFYSIPEAVNKVSLRGGRMPESADECLADGLYADDSILGTQVVVADNNEEDTLDALTCRTYTVVGYVATPLYMDLSRGTTSIGSGSLSGYVYIPREGFDVDYYTEVGITIPGDYAIYTDAYNDALEAASDSLEPELEAIAQKRFQELKQEAEDAYSEGLEEYLQGVKELQDGKLDAERELADAEQKLLDAQQQIEDNEALLTQGQAQLAGGKAALAESQEELEQSRKALTEAMEQAYGELDAASGKLTENYNTVNANLQQVNDGLQKVAAALDEVNAGITEFEQSGMTEQMLEPTIQAVQDALTQAEDALKEAESAGASGEVLDQMRQQADALYKDLERLRQVQSLYTLRPELQAQQAELQRNKTQLEAAMESIQNGFAELESSKALMDSQFADTQAQLDAGRQQVEAGWAELAQNEQKIADGWAALEEAKEELADGWKSYETGKAEAEQEIADAEQKLADAKLELDEARADIDEMPAAELYILDRNSNVGFASLDSSSDIVAGVSRVFPAFFLLVAALVCITTMTRMIEDERTQIGTLKTLGYSNGAIISKYLLYAGSGALIGCGLGVLAGSVVFPKILWQAYCIMLYITPDVVLTFDWVLCGVVVGAYTAVMLLVTWYCCRKTLREEPAELIRPKAPVSGKKILLERLPFWHRISFLNKVTIRNIFRYRQRLVMMMVGIGGCTALLVTGFGLRDSLVNVVDYQFEEVTVYDLSVYFSDDQKDSQQQAFLAEVEDGSEDVLFYHQSSVELDFDGRTKQIYMISAGEQLARFIDLHSGGAAVALPGENEVVLSVGVAEAMGVGVGDAVVLRDADMRMLELRVSGIYENHVYNYAVVAPETIENQWGALPGKQMAFIKTAQGEDPHALGARISGLEGVMNVSVSQDLAEMVGSMMDALDLVVVVVVFCAGLLAVIVLYNLTNINITERIREIATIKVLGFRASETAAYVFKENLSLTVIGGLLGLLMGQLLLQFVMSQIKIDIVWFKALVTPQSYVWAIMLTMLSACLVDLIFYFKLEKINMAEALKSVE